MRRDHHTAFLATPDGVFWFIGQQIIKYDGFTLLEVEEPEAIVKNYTQAIDSSPNGDLWVGSRSYGAFKFDGQTWRVLTVRDGLIGNSIQDILCTDDGAVWFATDQGISRFDGQTITTQALHPDIKIRANGGFLHTITNKSSRTIEP